MICDFGDIVAVPFPFVDIPISKRRPALVLSNAAFNEQSRHTVLAMITTGARSDWPHDIAIRDGAAAGIHHRSVIRWKLFTLPNDLIERRLGHLEKIDQTAVSEALVALFR